MPKQLNGRKEIVFNNEWSRKKWTATEKRKVSQARLYTNPSKNFSNGDRPMQEN
jgi:hypothetical protein